MILTPDELAQVQAQAVAEYPAECCGVLMVRDAPSPDRLLMRCRNIQDDLHDKDPRRHPRDSRTAYFIDPKDLLAIGRREGEGYRVATIYHSHIDTGAYFSPTDRQNALIDGEPAYPDAVYVVLSVVERRVVAAAMGIALGMRNSSAKGTRQFAVDFQKTCDMMAATRP